MGGRERASTPWSGEGKEDKRKRYGKRKNLSLQFRIIMYPIYVKHVCESVKKCTNV